MSDDDLPAEQSIATSEPGTPDRPAMPSLPGPPGTPGPAGPPAGSEENPERARARPTFRDRTFRWKSMVAVAAASLIVGGAGGATIATLVEGDGHPGRPGIGRFGHTDGMVLPGREGARPDDTTDGTAS